MSYLIDFSFDGLTEEERNEVLSKLRLIRDNFYPDLDIDCTGLHRENRVWIKQVVDDDKACELQRLLCNVSVVKAYDDYYQTGVDSRLVCSLSFIRDFPL